MARAFTCVPAEDRDEFLAGLRAGLTLPAGRAGSYARLTADLARLALLAGADQARQVGRREPGAIGRLAALVTLLPFAVLLPLVTAAVYADEQLFAWRHFKRFAGEAERARRRRPPLLGRPAAGASRP